MLVERRFTRLSSGTSLDIKGYGRLTGPAKDGVHIIKVKLADGKSDTVKAKNVVLATGSDARMLPGYKADDTILTNYEILKIEQMPKSLVVIGSGAVGVEFASIFKSFGAWRHRRLPSTPFSASAALPSTARLRAATR